MSYNYAYHRRRYVLPQPAQPHIQLLPRSEVPYRTAPPHRLHSSATQLSPAAVPPRPRNGVNNGRCGMPRWDDCSPVNPAACTSRPKSGGGRKESLDLVQMANANRDPEMLMDPMFAKFDRLLDMMESRMDAVDRRVENLRRKQYPSPHQSRRSRNIPDGFSGRHSEDAANRCVGYPRAPPLPEPPPHPTPSPPYAQRTRCSYLPHSQPPPARSNSSGYTARQFLPPTKQTCWDLPVPRQYVGSPVSDATPARPTRRWDQPVTRILQQVSAQPSSVRQPTCWDPPEQHGYAPHEPPMPVQPLDRECAKFRCLPQQPQSHHYRGEVDEDSCYGKGVTHAHSPTLDVRLRSYVANELTDQKEVGSYSSSLDVQIAYSCSDCVDDRDKGVEELCDSRGSILETGVKETMDRGLPSENMGSRESGDDIPKDQQVSSFVEIYPPRSHDMSEVEEEVALLDDVEEDDSADEVKKVVVSLNDVQVPSKNVVGNCWGKKGDGAYTGLNVVDVPSIAHHSTSLDVDGRFIPPRIDTPYLSILGSDRGIRSAVRYAFDPGGDASPKLLLSTLVVGSWFPP